MAALLERPQAALINRIRQGKGKGAGVAAPTVQTCYTQAMSTKELTLPADLAALIEARVASGAGDTEVDVLRAALAALEAEDARKLQSVREKIARSLADPRPSIPANTVFDNVDKLLDSLKP
jgi:antitoxin ParD1/3/4